MPLENLEVFKLYFGTRKFRLILKLPTPMSTEEVDWILIRCRLVESYKRGKKLFENWGREVTSS